MSRNTCAVIDVPALARNIERVRARFAPARIMAVVKADAYGHDLKRCLPALLDADLLAVATLDEARSIRALDSGVPILLLEGIMSPDELEAVHSLRLEMVVHEACQLDWLERDGRPCAPRVWLKIDTGMHRLGFPADMAEPAWRRLRALPAVREVVLMSHFACADDAGHPLNRAQVQAFDAAVSGLEGPHCLANSAAALQLPETRRDWVRTGLLVYGVAPLPGQTGSELGLEPVMTLKTRLIATRRVPAGDCIGYGARFRVETELPIGVAAIGYGDGYPRNTPDGTPVLVNGRRQLLAGRVSMDMITIDLSGQPEAGFGDPVVLWGGALPIEEVAEHVGTIPYELMCRVTRRVRYREIPYLRNAPRS